MLDVGLEPCLRWIREREAEVCAWVEVSPQEPLGDGLLAGVTFGAKDIYETRGLATEYGSPLYRGRRGERDAALITRLRQRGAILLGKTQTAAFASFDPAPTRNPRAPGHTPGGSSSGSAAAVAAGMAAFTLGTQTLGSVIRPASYCGVVGFKPTFGRLPLEGVLGFAPSLDTAGLFTATAADMRDLWERMGMAPAPPERFPRLGLVRLRAEPVMEAALAGEAASLRAQGLDVDEVELPFSHEDLWECAVTVNEYEGARTHEQRWREFGERLGRKLAALVARGLAIPVSRYEDALAAIAGAKQTLPPMFAANPVLLLAAATGPPPEGLDSTGDPILNGVWTALGTPAITVPLTAPPALPLGLQLVAAPGADGALVAVAAAVSEGGTAGRK